MALSHPWENLSFTVQRFSISLLVTISPKFWIEDWLACLHFLDFSTNLKSGECILKSTGVMAAWQVKRGWVNFGDCRTLCMSVVNPFVLPCLDHRSVTSPSLQQWPARKKKRARISRWLWDAGMHSILSRWFKHKMFGGNIVNPCGTTPALHRLTAIKRQGKKISLSPCRISSVQGFTSACLSG